MFQCLLLLKWVRVIYAAQIRHKIADSDDDDNIDIDHEEDDDDDDDMFCTCPFRDEAKGQIFAQSQHSLAFRCPLSKGQQTYPRTHSRHQSPYHYKAYRKPGQDQDKSTTHVYHT